MPASIITPINCTNSTIKPAPRIPFFSTRVSAGFPSPADDYVERSFDLNELCIQHPAATYVVRVEGESMTGAGILPGDILVVDRSLRANHSDIVVASVYGELTVKELSLRPTLQLVPHNPDFLVINIGEGSDFEIFGVVSSVIRQLKPHG